MSALRRSSALVLLLAGVCNALFWALALPLGTFAGRSTVLNALWNPGQLLHVLAALFMLPGCLGLFLLQKERLQWWGITGFYVVLCANAMYLADGVLGLVVWPITALHAPALIEPGGALFDTPVFLIFQLTFLLGYSLWGASLIYARAGPRVALGLLIAGAILFNFPAGIPFIVQALGGIIWGVAATWLGVALLVEWKTTGVAALE